MQQRLTTNLQDKTTAVTVGTFHSLCLNLLREYSDHADFEIIDDEHKKLLTKEIWPDTPSNERQALLEKISYQKATLFKHDNSELVSRTKELNQILLQHRKWDFDDLLLATIDLLESNKTVCQKIYERYRYTFVDEYQDINAAQHRLLKLLVHETAHITAIGDPNQAIYSFRGSDPAFFQQFTDDFPGATSLYLEKNYRSGANLISASGQVIEHSTEGLALALSPALLAKGQLTTYSAATDKAEAESVVHQIERMVGGTSMFSQDSGRVAHEQDGERSFGDIAILYRLNAMKVPLEEALLRSGMPYQIAGDVPLIAKQGVQAFIAMIRAISRLPFDSNYLAQFISLITPGFGASSAEKAAVFFSYVTSFNADTILQMTNQQNFNTNIQEALYATFEAVQILEKEYQEKALDVALEEFMKSPAIKAVEKKDVNLSQNWQRLIRIARRFKTSRQLLDVLSLQGKSDEFDSRAEKIAVMTLHASKGLEFPVVFIVGCEEGLVPMNLEKMQSDPEEERRLFYVGMTRAKEQLYLLHAKQRMLFGKMYRNEPSRFLADIEEELKAYEYWQSNPRREKTKVVDKQLKLF